jgi:hypothetical protein
MLSGLNPDLPIRASAPLTFSLTFHLTFPSGNLPRRRIILDPLPGISAPDPRFAPPPLFVPHQKRILTINSLHRRHWQT